MYLYRKLSFSAGTRYLFRSILLQYLMTLSKLASGRDEVIFVAVNPSPHFEMFPPLSNINEDGELLFSI